MARSRRTPEPDTATVDAEESAKPGHNSGKLTPDQEQALFILHLSKLRAQEKLAAEAKAAYDAERATLTDLFRVAKADGFTRKELQGILDDGKALRRDLIAEELRRSQLRAWAGLPTGVQGDLFNTAAPLEVQDEQAAEGLGYSTGLRGDDATMPDHIQPRFAPAFMRGWHAGQEKLAWGLAEAGKVVDRRTDVQASAPEIDPEPEDEAEIDPEEVEVQARKLQRSGFMDTSIDEAEQPMAAAE